MKILRPILCSITAIAAIAHAGTTQRAPVFIDSLASHLESLPSFRAQASSTITSSQMADDVAYDLTLMQFGPASADTLHTAPYLIDWSAGGDHGSRHGFSAYYSGNFYRFNGERLSELHLPADSLALCISMPNAVAIHRSVQFFNLLPQGIAASLRNIIADSTWHVAINPDTIVDSRHAIAVYATQSYLNQPVAKTTYIFNSTDRAPLRIDIENNIGQLSELSSHTTYSAPTTSGTPAAIDEAFLASRYPEPFTKLRRHNFSIHNLPGRHLPAFALPTTTGNRISRRISDPLPAPTLLIIADSSAPETVDLIPQVRKAVATTSGRVDIIWAFTDAATDRIDSIVGEPRRGEEALISAGSLARNCGASTLPAMILTDTDGIVTFVASPVNNDALSDVIEKIAGE